MNPSKAVRMGDKLIKETRLSPTQSTIILMAAGFCVFIILMRLIGPARELVHRVLLIGLVVTVMNVLVARIAMKRKLWAVRGAWPVFGYPFSMIVAWLFLTAGFCLLLSRLPSLCSALFVAALAGFGGSLWDLTVHKKAGILVVDRAKPWHLTAYWMASSLLAAFLLFLPCS